MIKIVFIKEVLNSILFLNEIPVFVKSYNCGPEIFNRRDFIIE